MRPTGRKLDALVGTKVMSVTYDCRCEELCRCWPRLPHFSTEPAAAWAVVEKLGEKFHAVIKTPFYPGADFLAGFTPHNATGWNGRPDYMAQAKSAPLAICLAALDAVENKLSDHLSDKR